MADQQQLEQQQHQHQQFQQHHHQLDQQQQQLEQQQLLQQQQHLIGLYVGNLTWWTTDQDVINAINSTGVNDIQEVKFFENRNNGQSKGFCVVTFGSETSLPSVIEKLPKLELHGQNPVVTPYNRQNLSLFENQTKPRPQINSNGPTTQHAAGIMGINSISGVHAAAAAAGGMPYTGVNSYNQGGMVAGNTMGGGPRNPNFHSNMRMQMRPPRGMMRGAMPGIVNNGPMMPGHQMNRMRFMQPQSWNNSQGGGYNPPPRPPLVGGGMDRLGGGGSGSGVKLDDIGQEMLPNSSSQNYYTPQHSAPDYYRNDIRDHRDLRDERDSISSSRRVDDRPSRLDDRSLGRHHDDRSTREDRPVIRDERLIRDERSSRHDDRSDRSRREDRGSSRRGTDDGGGERSRRDDRRDDRSSRKEEKTTSSSSSSRREKSHRSDERDRDRRTRSRSRERSRERKERRDRRDRY